MFLRSQRNLGQCLAVCPSAPRTVSRPGTKHEGMQCLRVPRAAFIDGGVLVGRQAGRQASEHPRCDDDER
uniref:Uncharacterized protein n=1 Tax=Physcomitrium patens TaxID=3218 RepID=A0A2K1KHD6_PHYPA|nr:hypothetical protein PHYPA_009569 [Physcomitrium patens]